MTQENKSLDILGIKPVGEAINTVTQSGVKGAGAFLSRICLPVAEEYGLLLRDKVRFWRTQNLAAIALEAERLVGPRNSQPVNAHPRIVHEILEKGSWSDDGIVQKMWAGLLASSCTKDRTDDGNIVFINILNQLTSSQIRILNYACEKAEKFKSPAGLPYTKELIIDPQELLKIAEIDDFHRLDRELDCLRILELIGSGGFGGSGGGLDPNSGAAKICPSAVALHLYVKAQGFMGTPVEYWLLEQEPEPQKEPNQPLQTTTMTGAEAVQPPRRS